MQGALASKVVELGLFYVRRICQDGGTRAGYARCGMISFFIHPNGKSATRDTKRVGMLGESAFIYRFVQLGFRVSIPFGENSPYDLIVESPDGRLFKIQVKTGRIRSGVLRFSAVSSHWHRGRPATRYDGRIDAFGIYSPSDDQCYLIGVADISVRGDHGYLRIEPARNNMQRGIHWARNYVLRADECPALFRNEADLEPSAGIEPATFTLPM